MSLRNLRLVPLKSLPRSRHHHSPSTLEIPFRKIGDFRSAPNLRARLLIGRGRDSGLLFAIPQEQRPRGKGDYNNVSLKSVGFRMSIPREHRHWLSDRRVLAIGS
jgi:hypothetical protein